MHEEALAAVSAPRSASRSSVRSSGRATGSEHAPTTATPSTATARTGLELPIIDEDALWSCTTCGACVNQCPVDIEHIDHFIDMRRNQVMIATEFPSELNGLFKNLETKGNPWGMNASGRNALDLRGRLRRPRVRHGRRGHHPRRRRLPVLGRLRRRIRGSRQAHHQGRRRAAHIAGVQFMVLGEGETCTGDPARRAGNEFLFQMQAMQNVEVLNEIKATKIVVTCPHCLNTLKREYPQLGGNYEVVHHTQLLNDLVKAGRLTPVAPVEPDGHLPRPVLPRPPQQRLRPAARPHRRHRCDDGRDGAPRRQVLLLRRRRRPHVDGGEDRHRASTRTAATRPSAPAPAKVAVACPFCSVMLNDAVTSRQSRGRGRGRRGRRRGHAAAVRQQVLAASPQRGVRRLEAGRIPAADAQHHRLGAGEVDDRRRLAAAGTCVHDASTRSSSRSLISQPCVIGSSSPGRSRVLDTSGSPTASAAPERPRRRGCGRRPSASSGAAAAGGRPSSPAG